MRQITQEVGVMKRAPDTESDKRFFDSVGYAYNEIVAVEKVL